MAAPKSFPKLGKSRACERWPRHNSLTSVLAVANSVASHAGLARPLLTINDHDGGGYSVEEGKLCKKGKTATGRPFSCRLFLRPGVRPRGLQMTLVPRFGWESRGDRRLDSERAAEQRESSSSSSRAGRNSEGWQKSISIKAYAGYLDNFLDATMLNDSGKMRRKRRARKLGTKKEELKTSVERRVVERRRGGRGGGVR